MKAYWYGDDNRQGIAASMNWGDICAPHILRAITARAPANVKRQGGRLLSVGSVLHKVRAGDRIWGTGAISSRHIPTPLPPVTVHAVRGPLTRAALISRGADVPEIYGDPALLLPRVVHLPPAPRVDYALGFIPHYADWAMMRQHQIPPDVHLIDIGAGFHEVIREVRRCSSIVSSCLHGIILAEALGIPVSWAQVDKGAHLAGSQPDWKFRDHFGATDRHPEPFPISSESHLFSLPLARRVAPLPDLDALLAAFPTDLP